METIDKKTQELTRVVNMKTYYIDVTVYQEIVKDELYPCYDINQITDGMGIPVGGEIWKEVSCELGEDNEVFNEVWQTSNEVMNLLKETFVFCFFDPHAPVFCNG